MKNILFLLFSIATFGQVSTGNETPFDYGIQNTAAQLVGNSDYVVTQGNDGTYGKYLFNLNNIEKKQFLSTGLIKNGAISINADPTKYNISAGVGVITNYDNPEIPTCTVVNFPAVTGKIPTYLTTGLITYVAVNSSGVIVEQATQFTTSQRRDLIILGAVIHSNLTTINVVNNISAPTNADTNQLHDLMSYIGALNLTGNKYTANGANLSLDKSAGSIFKAGVNFAADWKKPHELEQSLQTLLTFRYRLSNGTEYADATVLNPAVYESGGTLISVPSNKFTIQTVTMFQTGLTRIQPGQNTYNSLAEAENAILTRSFVVESNIAQNGITRAYVILRNSATSLQNTSDAKIVETTKFGGVASGGVSLSDAAIIAALGYTPENLVNKQNNLSVDGSGVKYPTVDAVNNNLFDTSKKWVLFGDSFSDTLLTGDYPYYVLQALHLTGTVTHAVGGHQINDQLTVMTNLLISNPNYFQNFDLVSVLVGVNDFAGSTAIGSRNSLITDNDYAGKLKNMIQKILNSNPDIDIFLMTPTEANSALVPYGTTNSAGWSLKELSVLIGQIASDYGIQCIDLYSLSNFNLQTIPSLTLDLLHPNATGIKYISETIISGFKTKNNAGKNIDFGLNKYTTNNFPIFKNKSIESSLLFHNTNNLGWNTLSSYSPYGLNINGAGADKMLAIGDFTTPSNRSDIYISTTSDARIYTGGGDLSFGGSDGAQDVKLLNNGNFGIGTTSPARKFVISNGGAQGLEFRGWDGSVSADIFAYNRATSTVIPITFNASSFVFGIGDVTANNINATSFNGSASLTGTPTSPTATVGTNTTQIATTAFVQSEKAITARKISTNTTLADSDNGKVILLTASCTVTLPNGLMNGFNCSFSTLSGATMTYALGGSVTLLNNIGTTMAEKLSHTIVNTGVSNEYLTAGSL